MSKRRRQKRSDITPLHGHYSPLRYPGGKAKVAPFIARLFELNNLCDGDYAEPYAGGSAVALYLLFGDFASRVHINDLDRSVYAFWTCVLDDSEWLCKKITDTRLSLAEWRRQRAIQDAKATVSIQELGFSTFFLNRTNRSGIIGSGSVIGGLEQLGEWGIGARYNASDLVRRVQRIAALRSRITVTNRDAIDFIGHAADNLPRRSLVYLDPPYFVKGRKLYANYYSAADHAAVSKALTPCPWPWVVSYDAVREIRGIYRGYRSREYDLRYTAAGSYLGSELMFFSPELKLPRGLAPTAPELRPSAKAS